MNDRAKSLNQLEHLLNTPDGMELMEELEMAWDPTSLLGADAQQTAHKVGLRDAYKFLKMLQRGEIYNG